MKSSGAKTMLTVNAGRVALAAAVVAMASGCITSAPAVNSDPSLAASSAISTPLTSVVSLSPGVEPSATADIVPPSITDSAAPIASPTPRPRRSKAPRPTAERTDSPAATATPTSPPTEPPTEAPTATPTVAGVPDLIIKSYSIPATVTHDEEAHGAMYVQNVGNGPAGAFSIDFYGSCQSYTFSQAPHRFDGLAPGEFAYMRLVFSFPDDDLCGVGIEIDHDNAVVESNESNNTANVAVNVQ